MVLLSPLPALVMKLIGNAQVTKMKKVSTYLPQARHRYNLAHRATPESNWLQRVRGGTSYQV